MKKKFFKHIIEAVRLAGMCDGKYHALIDGMLDIDIKPSKYAKVVIKRIENAYANRFIFEK